MSYSTKTWNRACQVLKSNPNISLSVFADMFEMTTGQAKYLIREVVHVWNIEREPERVKVYKKNYARDRKIPNRPLDDRYSSRSVASQNSKFTNPNHN